MGQGLLVLQDSTEIAHIEPAAARLTFEIVLGFGQRRSTGHLADDCPARDSSASCLRAWSFILWIEHKPLAVDYLAVLSDRHVYAGAALGIG